MPREINEYDEVLGEDALSTYETALDTVVYIKSVDGFSGDGNFFSKFGLNIKDQVVFSIARTTFAEEVEKSYSISRPREGDIIFFRMNRKPYQITYVKNFEMFYPLGALYTWEMTCELFEYGGEKFTTGIPMIDAINDQSQDLFDHAIEDESGDPILDELGDFLVNDAYDPAAIDPLDSAKALQTETDGLVDFSETNPFGEK